MPLVEINLDGWQDYRGTDSGVLLYIETSMQSVLPVRDQLNDNEKGFFHEPNYETSTWGLESCLYAKRVNALIKERHKFMLFGTRYGGFDPQFKDKFLIMGFLEIEKVRDMRDRHLRQYMIHQDEGAEEPECLTLDRSMAAWGNMHLVNLEDCFVVTLDWLKQHELKGRPSRQLRMTVQDEALAEILDHLKAKPNVIGDYVQIVDEFISVMDEVEDSDD